MSCGELRDLVTTGRQPALVLFGTGWGLTEEVVGLCDRMLEPISGGAITIIFPFASRWVLYWIEFQ
jgi:hypothetical protein